MSRRFAIADTCFIIDWARYNKRDLLFKLFVVFVPEAVLREVKSEETISWLASALARGDMALYTESTSDEIEARALVEESKKLSRLPSVDYPEALCLVVAKKRGYVVLTENRGAIIAADILPEYQGVEIWRAFEIITELIRRGHLEHNCDDPLKPYLEYQQQTKHIFPQKDLRKAEEEFRRGCSQN